MAKTAKELFAEVHAKIEVRNERRKPMQIEFRGPVALEQIADEMLLLRAEMTTIRQILASYAARPAIRS